MDCQNCGFTNKAGISNCLSCDYPLEGNEEKVKGYNRKVAGININYKYLSTHYLNTILVLAMFFLIATIFTFSYKLIKQESNFFPMIILGFISALYLLIYTLGKKSNEFLYLSKFSLLFYIIHTAIELVTNIYPKNISGISAVSVKMSLYSSIEHSLPYFYIGLRIAILYFFIKGLLAAIKLNREKKALQYYLTIETYRKISF